MPNAHEIAKEVEDFYRTFMEAFNRQDIVRQSKLVDLPYALISGEGGVIVCSTESEHQRLSTQIFADLKARAVGHVRGDRVRVSLFAQNHALIVSDITRRRTDNSVLQKSRFCYTARHDGTSWKMMAYSPVADGFLGPGNFSR